MSKTAAFFDLDKTIIAMSSALAYGRQFFKSGLISASQALALSYAQTAFLLQGWSGGQMDSTRDKLLDMVTGWDVSEVADIAQTMLHEVVTPAIYAEARELIAWHKGMGHDVVIVSASVRDLVVPIAKELGVDRVLTSELEVCDGKYTGRLLTYNKGVTKITRVAEMGYNLATSYAYSDSETDIPLLAAVGHPVAVNPDKHLTQWAKENGVPIRRFINPVPLFTPPHPWVAAGAAIVIVIALIAIFWRSPRPPAHRHT